MKRSLWPTRDPVKDYFPLPKEIFSLGLSAAEIAIYAYLLFCEDRQTFQCWPSYRKIGEAVGLSPNTIRKHIGLSKNVGYSSQSRRKLQQRMVASEMAIYASPSEQFNSRSNRTMIDRCRSWTRTQQGGNMPILLKTQVDRTAKTPVTARRARVGGLRGFRSPAERRTRGKPENRTLRQRAGVLQKRQTQRRMPASGFRQREKPQAAKQDKAAGSCAPPQRSHLPAVRAVSGIYEGVVESAKIVPRGS